MRKAAGIPQTDHVGLQNWSLGMYLKGMCLLAGGVDF
jgi:hypothetical protein